LLSRWPSADLENEYFSEGLTEELINALTKIKDLHAVARTSSFVFKSEKAGIRKIGEKLNVETLMDVYGRKGMYDEAIAAGEIMLELGGRATGTLRVLGAYYAEAGQKDKSSAL
jgi:hypothetical protein